MEPVGVMMTSAVAKALVDAPAAGLGDAVEVVIEAVGVAEAEPAGAADADCGAASASFPEALALCSPPEDIVGSLW